MPDPDQEGSAGKTIAPPHSSANAEAGLIAKPEAQLRQIYDDYRTALFNYLYYSERVAYIDGWRLAFDIVIALFATGSPVAGWALWKSDSLKSVWAIIAGIGAVLAIVGPLLKLTDKVKSASELRSGYCLIYFDLKEIAHAVAARRALHQAEVDQYKATVKRMGELTAKDGSSASAKTKSRLQRQVNATIPPRTLWMPRRK